MRRAKLAISLGVAASGCAPATQAVSPASAPLSATLTNSVGMEFVLVQPETMVVAKFQPTCPTLSGGGGGGGGGGAGGGGQQPPGGAGAQGGAGGQPGAAAQGGGGQAGAAGPQPAAPRPAADPRSQWDAADVALCAQQVARDASPGFTVRIERPYYIGKYEVTQGQWKAVMGNNPSVFQGSRVTDDADQHPVDNVTWQDAQAFIRRLNEMDRTARYRLPTEFEWEYAARGGSQADNISWTEARTLAVSGRTTMRVGTKAPNGYGLYDIYGNVWEWVEDFYNDKTFPDPVPPRTGTEHVLKGASVFGDVKNFTWATHGGGPGNGFDNGFRIVREAP